MFKKLTLSCTGMVALVAFALPAVASAANTPTLRDSEGVVKVGSKIWGTNQGNIIFWNTATSIVQITCTSAKFTAEVTANAADTVEAKISTFDVEGTGQKHPDNNLPECTNTSGTGFGFTMLRMPLILKSTAAMAEHEFQLSGTGGNVRFQLLDTRIGTCEYEATSAALKGDYTTGTAATPSTLKITDTEAASGVKRIAGSIFCPASYTLGMEFKLETDGGNNGPVWITQT